jgi:GMP synthase-like glutamine amidotransferase
MLAGLDYSSSRDLRPADRPVPRAVVIQTQEDAPPGLLGAWAERRGVGLGVVRVDREERLPDPREPAFAVVLGSGASAAGGGPAWVEHTIEWLRAADAAALPVLGICFGAQALAAALGGSVRRNPEPEVGWITVESNDAEHVPCGPWLAWHEDGFTLPPLAYELARNRAGVQAFCHCRHLAVQFHPEVTPRIVSGWAANDHGDLERAGITRGQLDEGTARHAERAARAAMTLFDGFATRAGLVAVASGL